MYQHHVTVVRDIFTFPSCRRNCTCIPSATCSNSSAAVGLGLCMVFVCDSVALCLQHSSSRTSIFSDNNSAQRYYFSVSAHVRPQAQHNNQLSGRKCGVPKLRFRTLQHTQEPAAGRTQTIHGLEKGELEVSYHSVLEARFGEKMVSGRRGEVTAFWCLALARRWFPGHVFMGAKSPRYGGLL